MIIFGIDPGSERTGYGCIASDGRRHRLLACGTISAPAETGFADRLHTIHSGLVALLAASAAGIPIVEYSPAEIKRAVVGFGRAEKQQVAQMVKLLLGLEAPPSPHDASDAIAIAICHVHTSQGAAAQAARLQAPSSTARSWRHYRP